MTDTKHNGVRVVRYPCCKKIFAAIVLEYDDASTRREHRKYAEKGYIVEDLHNQKWEFGSCTCPKSELPQSLRKSKQKELF